MISTKFRQNLTGTELVEFDNNITFYAINNVECQNLSFKVLQVKSWENEASRSTTLLYYKPPKIQNNEQSKF